MTENESLTATLQNAIECATDDITKEDLEMMVKCLEELQQYRAIGTVEGYKRALEISKENFRVSMEYKAKVQEYETIGTIEEFMVLKEKNEPKMGKWNFDSITATWGKPYRCSECDEEYEDTYNYCPNCGAEMD